jgi:hypothetical protein
MVPAANIESLDVEDMLSWNFNAYCSWGVDVGGSPRSFKPSAPFDRHELKTFRGGQQLVFPRSFEGIIGEDKGYWEVLQPFVQVFGLHYLSERSAYCRLDDRGDIEDVIRILRIRDDKDDGGGGTIITFKRQFLDEWALLSNSVIIRTFDFTRHRRGSFNGWSNAVQDPKDGEAKDIYYRYVIEPDHASYVRGCQIIRPNATTDDLNKRFGWGNHDERQYAEFIALDWKNGGQIKEISCAPGAIANYFTKSELPFEVTPAFFRPDVLLKYKSDTDKYTLKDRSISCRGTWSLKTYDINDAGQVHTYLVYLRDMPYEEQLHWRAYNEAPKGTISKRAYTTDFKGEFHTDYEPLGSLKRALQELAEAHVPWWTLRAEKLVDQTNIPATTSADEWASEIMNLDQLLVEGFEEKWLRKKAQSLARTPKDNFRSLKLVEECLMALGFEEDHARQVTAPLHHLHDYRSKIKGHASGNEAAEIRRAVLSEYGTYRKHFQALSAECDASLRTVMSAFKDFK